jgi:BlaI family penicillinase repressor
MTKTEWLFMNICWKKGKVSARVIYEDSLKQKRRAYPTVKTILDRLARKGYLIREKFGPIWLYEPVVSQKSMFVNEMDLFTMMVLDNSFTPVFNYIAQKRKLTADEIDSLKELLKVYESEAGKT